MHTHTHSQFTISSRAQAKRIAARHGREAAEAQHRDILAEIVRDVAAGDWYSVAAESATWLGVPQRWLGVYHAEYDRSAAKVAHALRVERARDLGREDGVSSALATYRDMRDEPDAQKPLRRDEARTMAAECAASRIAHRELDPSVRDEYEAACTDAHLAAWPVRA